MINWFLWYKTCHTFAKTFVLFFKKKHNVIYYYIVTGDVTDYEIEFKSYNGSTK